MEGLTDDLIVEILSHVAAKSLNRIKCVSKRWLGLIDHPDHRKKLPQILAGFFHTSTSGKRSPKSALRFVNVLGIGCPPIDISFSFLPSQRPVEFLDCCNGLLLCRCYQTQTPGDDDECCYAVCNPATEEWVALPDPCSHGCKMGVARLGFDPAVSSNFYLFVLLVETIYEFYRIVGVEVYSSENRRWVHKKEGWDDNITLSRGTLQSGIVFLNGYLHFPAAYGRCSSLCLAAVDTNAETWTIFHTPHDLLYGFLQQSQGYLHYSEFQRDVDGAVVGLVVYVLKDYENKEWILKHSVANSHMTHLAGYRRIVIHPQCDMMFFAEGWGSRFVCYNMDCQQVTVISNREYGDPPYLPYVPFYAKLQSLHP